MFKFLLATILGGIIYFAWHSISWMVLPWHDQTINHFQNEESVMAAIEQNTDKGGVYVLPKPESYSEEKGKQGLVFISYQQSENSTEMKKSIKLALINSLLMSFLIVILLSCTTDLSYSARVFFVVMTGLVGALIGHGSNWIWWSFDSNYTIIMIADVVIGWFFAGLIMAGFIGREPDYKFND